MNKEDNAGQQGQQGQQGQPSVRDRVDAVIQKIRPVIQMDGGDINLVGVDDKGVVTVQLQGAASAAPAPA